ncbi:hypothetical protein GGI04_003368 [Coemansia thaxteri]|nr:hypothetical protein GGI04_003368 [Coemansia thaxteri]
MNAHNLVANLSLPSSALALSTPQPPGQVESNGSGYIGNPLGTPHSALPTAGGSQSLPQQGHAHVSTPFVQQMRPYNMMFGIHGLPEPRMLYDDRMSLPPLPHNGGNWLRIRQPIDYVAPLKKPMNSFLLYSAERRVQLRQTHPDLNTTQQSTILAREWASLPEEEKEKYRAEAKQLRDDYNARRAELSLKLQQQLNQQHLNMSLGHQPPPPLTKLLTLFNSRWQEFNLAGSDSLRDNTAISQQYGLPRPPSSVSQYVNANDLGQQRFQQQRSYADADGLSSTMLNSSNGLFGTTFDSIIQPSDFGGGMPGFSSSGSKTLNHASSYASFSDASMLPRIHSALFDGEQEKSSELRRESNRDAPEHVNSHDTASQDPSSLSLGGVGGGGSSSAELAAASKQRARLSSPIKRARKKTKKDPDAPKHPMSAFLYFLTSERPRLAEQLSDMSIGQQTKIIAKQWKELDENDRAPWERLAKHDKDRYARERREYHSENRHTEAAAAAPN